MADTTNTDEGLFISLQVSLQALQGSLDEASKVIQEQITKIDKELAGIGKAPLDNKPLDETNEKLQETESTTKSLSATFQKFFGLDANKVLNQFGLNLDDVVNAFTSPAGLVGALSIAGKKVLQLGMQFEEAFGDIAKRTGAVGANLDALEKSLVDLGSIGLETTFEKAGSGLAALNVNFGVTGQELEDLTLLFADFADVTGQDLAQSVADVSPLMKKWGVDIADTESLLDKLTKAGQISGASVQSLTSNLMQGASQFQAIGYGIDESLALLSAFEKQGVKTENVMTGINKAIGYFSERNVDAAQGLQIVIEKIKSSTSETEALNVATNVFGMRSGVEFAAAIRSGKFALDDYISIIKNSAGTLERTDKASQTLGDRMAILGNMAKAAFAPLGGMLVETANGILDKLIPALSTANTKTGKLSSIHEELKANTDALKISIDDYKKANNELNDKTKTLNDTEKDTIENRREIAKLNITTNLSKTVESLGKLGNEYKKQGAATEDYQANIKRFKDQLEYLNLELAKQEAEAQRLKSIGFKDFYIKTATSVDMVKASIADYNKLLIKNQDALALNQDALKKANDERTRGINDLAEAVTLGSIDISQIEIRNSEIAKEVAIRIEKLKAVKKEQEVKKENNKESEKETDLTYEQIDAAKKLKEIESERLKLKEQIEKDYTSKTSSPIERLKIEKAEALKQAQEVGANTVLLEKYYNDLITTEEKKALDEQIAAHIEKNTIVSANEISYYEQNLKRIQEQSVLAIDAVNKLGGDTKITQDFWNAQILAATIDLNTAKEAAAKESANKQLAIEKAKVSANISIYETIIAGVGAVAKSIDAQMGEVVARVSEFGISIAKVVASGGTDVASWIAALSQGIAMYNDWKDSINEWLDKYVNKLSAAERYTKYAFKKIKESFQDSIGEAFSSAFEDGIKVEELKKIIGKKILKVAIDSALYAAGLEDAMKKIGDMVSKAIKNGFDKTELDSINAEIEKVYATASTVLEPLAASINESFDLIEKDTKKHIGSFADYVNETWKETSKAFTENMSSTFVSAFTDGFDLSELKKRIGQQLMQVAIESALFTIGFQDKMEALGALVAKAIDSGFTQQSLDAISTMVDQIYAQANAVITPIASIIGNTFGTNSTTAAATTTTTPTTTEAEKQTGIVYNQTINVNAQTGTAIDVKRATEEGAKSAFFNAGLTA
jgi:TP901 family phage tail tape measure protein